MISLHGLTLAIKGEYPPVEKVEINTRDAMDLINFLFDAEDEMVGQFYYRGIPIVPDDAVEVGKVVVWKDGKVKEVVSGI